jgi:ABC-2 type transport system permease protein
VAIVLLRLKLAIQRRARGRGGLGQRVWFVLAWVIALVLGIAAGAAVAAASSVGGGQGDLGVLLIFTTVFGGWLLVPVLLPGLGDQTVDPAKLEQFPIAPRDQVGGLLLGGLVAPTALFTLLVAAGASAVSEESWMARIAVLLAAVVFTVLCVVASRAVQALLAGVVRGRRGRDLMVVAGGIIGLGIYLITQSAHNLTESLLGLESSPVEEVLAWLPPGSVGQTVLDARDGSWGLALIHLAVALVAIAGFVALWTWAIRRRVKGPAGHNRPAAAQQAADTELDLVPLPLSVFGPSPAVAAASQQLRYYLRSPQAIQGALFPLVIGAVLGHTMAGDGGLIIAAAFFALLATSANSMVTNVFGFDDRGYTFLLSVGAPWRSVLVGKVMVAQAILIPAVGLFVIVEALLAGSWAQAVEAFLVGAAVLLVGSGVGALLSVWAPQNRVSMKVDRGRALLALFGGMLAIALISAVVGVGWILLSETLDVLVLAVLTVGVAVVVAWALTRWAAGRLSSNPWQLQQLLSV